ncbi:MAG: catC [Bradyrhizobium sp.]|nr:catC [Bradyrhizobium sp.]
MLFQVEMNIRIPPDADPEKIKRLGAEETALAQELQRVGIWVHIWRVVGKRANISIFKVADAGELHDILTRLPLFAYMDIKVTALCQHPASIAAAAD